jgi:SAM-dependent methyltransferase/peptidoglycan/xylan/chitin deacetylase (PgdA/CDA1 family)
VLNTLRDFAREHPGRQPELNITSFAIASPEARAVLDRTCMVGKGWWTDTWWRDAIASGLMHIGNHSWDHNHETLPDCLAQGVTRGTFAAIATRELADLEVRKAAEYLRAHAANPAADLFAYPYGHAVRYLAGEYFPCHGGEVGVRAAFTDRAEYLEPGCDRWAIPRFVCGRDWQSPEALAEILDEAAEGAATWNGTRRPRTSAPPPARAQTPPRAARVAAPQVGSSTTHSRKLITDEEYRTKFTMVPKVLKEWVGEHRPLEGLEILDFGCGEATAALALALESRVGRVVGVDIGLDPERCAPLAKAQLGLDRLPDNLELYRVQPGFLHDDDDRFDLVYSWSVFEHVDERLVGDVLRRIRASLKPGGLLFIQIAPLYHSAEGSHLIHRLHEPWAHLLHQEDVLQGKLRAAASDEAEFNALWGTYITLNRVTADELRRHLEANGFEVLRFHTTKDGPRPPERLTAIYREEILATNQVLILARPNAARIMSPPRAASVAGRPERAAPGRRLSRVEVAFTPPARDRPSRGLVEMDFAVEGPAGDFELALTTESSVLHERKFRLPDAPTNVVTFLNTHFLRNGVTKLRASIAQGTKKIWSEDFALNVSNTGRLADQVRASLREYRTPLVLADRVDSSDFDIANPSLQAWFDRPDALSRLDAQRDAGAVSVEEAVALRQFVKDGYAILPTPVEESLLAEVNRELDDAIEKKVEGYAFGTSQRIQHLHRRYPGVRTLWTHPFVRRYLELIFGVPPRACQTLTYIFGSQQGAHQDTVHLTPFPAGYMCGVWIALEDVRADSGELEVYRGSHRLPRVYMHGSGCAKVTNDDWTEFGDTVAARWRDMIARGGFEKITYRPRRGTILIWHENLMHGGAVRVDQSLSRRSIVSHYFADGAIAFYDSTGVAGHME